MTAIRKSLLQLVFSGAYLLRWNDKLRPVELVELDKQAHKMLTACLLWQENTASLPCERRTAIARRIVEGGIADYLYRLIITDIKPPVFYRIKENPEHFRQLTKHVLKRLEPSVEPLGDFWLRLQQWHEQPPETAAAPDDLLARRILAAAHMYASSWEFFLIRPVNTFDEEMEEIAASFHSRLEAFRDLSGMTAILDGTDALARVANLCGRLRFQIRWTQVPRIPATSVLGHMFLVAVYAYFFSLKIGACPARACNNFFCGLLHDLPGVGEEPGAVVGEELYAHLACHVGDGLRILRVQRLRADGQLHQFLLAADHRLHGAAPHGGGELAVLHFLLGLGHLLLHLHDLLLHLGLLAHHIAAAEAAHALGKSTLCHKNILTLP